MNRGDGDWPHGGRGGEGPREEPLGLRERKKLATRRALSAAAIRLAVERGFDNLRVEDIAEAAGVSPRTFNNYFSSREQAICAARADQVARMGEALLARPAEESLIDALINAMTRGGDPPPDRLRAVLNLFVCNPTLHGEFLRSAAQTTSPLVEAIAQRTGTRPDDLLPHVVASAAFGALRAAMDQWLHAEDPPPFSAVLHDALNQLRELAGTAQAATPTDGAAASDAAADPESGAAASAAVSPASARPAIIDTRAA